MSEEKFDNTSAFDRYMLVRESRYPVKKRNAFRFVNDDLEVCIVMAKSLFGSAQSAEVVLALYDRVMDRAVLDERPRDYGPPE